MIMNNASVKREDIGEIKIHDNYSFVQVSKEVADKVIAALNDYNYRGKKLVVNPANEKMERAECYAGEMQNEASVDEKVAD